MVFHLPQGKSQSPCSGLNPTHLHNSHHKATPASSPLLLKFINFTQIPVQFALLLLYGLSSRITLSMKIYCIFYNAIINSPHLSTPYLLYAAWCFSKALITFWHTLYYLLICFLVSSSPPLPLEYKLNESEGFVIWQWRYSLFSLHCLKQYLAHSRHYI